MPMIRRQGISIPCAIFAVSVAASAVAIWLVAVRDGKHSTMRSYGSFPHVSTPEALIRRRADLAMHVANPTIADIRLANDRLLPIVRNRLRSCGWYSISQVLHGMSTFGADLSVSEDGSGPVSAVDVICEARLAERLFGRQRVLAKTRQGLRFALIDRRALSTDQSNTQSHIGQGLAVLAGSGVPLDYQVTLADDRKYTVGDILSDTIDGFILDGEIYWDAVALAIYLPPHRTWRNKFGEEFNFDQLAIELMQRPPSESSCGGTHALIALTTMRRVDEVTPIISHAIRYRLDEHLRSSVDHLRKSMLPRGGWTFDWRAGDSLSPSSFVENDINANEFILATGHHLEWLIMLPKPLQLERSALKLSSEHLLESLWAASEDPNWLREHYCPASHAARSLHLISNECSTIDSANDKATLSSISARIE